MPTQTPASRKFAPPSARSSVAAAPSSSRPAFINHLVRTSQSLSSPSARKPFSNTIKDGGSDEIDVDEEDDDLLLPRHPPITSAGRNSCPSAVDLNGNQHGKPQGDQILSHAISSTKRRKLSHFISETIDDHGSESSSSPLPPSPSTRTIEQDIHVEVPHTSPEGAPHNDTVGTTYHDDDSSDPAEYSPNAQNITTPQKHNRYSNPISRFKAPQYPFPPPSSSNIPPQQSTNAIHNHSLPSFQSRLLASSSSSTSHNTGPHLRGPQPSLDFTLPDAFSPSRRRGNREYLHSGHAETVRRWILDLAARTNTPTAGESRHSNSKTKSTLQPPSQRLGGGDRGRICVEDVMVRDPAGRFLIVKAENETGVEGTEAQDPEQEQEQEQTKEAGESMWWLLTNVDQHHHQGFGVGGSKFDRVKCGVWIVVKGGEVASWMLDLGIKCGGADSKMRVAVLWDLVR